MRLSRHSLSHFWVLPSLVSILIFSVSFHNMPLFHTLAELTLGAIALTMFVMVWYSYRYNRNHFLLFLGLGYGWIACVDLAHTLSFKGVGLLSEFDANPATQLWIAARYFEAILLVLAPLFLTRTVRRKTLNIVFGSTTVFLVAWVWLGYFPTAYVEGPGLTTFKIFSEYVIIGLLLIAMAHICFRQRHLDRRLVYLVCLSILLTIIAEYMFTLYIQVDEIPIVAGHLLNLFSRWLLFVVIAQTMFVEPSRALARNAAMFDNLPMPTVVVDADGTIYESNMTARKIQGSVNRDLIGQNCHDTFHPRSLSHSDCPVCSAIRDRSVIADLNVWDGSNNTWTSFTLSPVDSEDPNSQFIHICRDITLRKSLEIEALETKASFELIVEMAPEAIISIDTSQNVILFNKAAEKTFGYAQSEIVGKTIDTLIPELSIERHRKHIENFILSEQINAPMRGGIGISGRHKSGSLFPAEASIVREDRQQGTVLTVILRDTSNQMMREQRLRKSEERFRTLADLASDWVWETDANSRFTYLSHQFKSPRALSAENVIGRTRKEFANPAPEDTNWQRHFDDLDNQREFRNFRYTGVGDDGKEIHFAINGTPRFDADGEFIGYIGTGRDITSVRQEVIESERQRILFETIVNGIPNALLFTNMSREIIAVNPGFEKIFGYKAEEVIGSTTQTLFAALEDYEKIGKAIRDPDVTMEESEFFVPYQRKSGEQFPGKMVGSPVRDTQGNRLGFVALISDISDQVMIEQQLRQSLKMEAVGQLTGGIAHDFNNLLTIIIGNLRLLEQERAISGDVALTSLLSDTLSAAKDGADLTSRLLAYSRKSSLAPGNQGLDDLIEGVVALASRTLREDIKVVHTGVGAQIGLFVDKLQFDGALLNLLLNAQDAMPDGGEIKISSHVVTVSKRNSDRYTALTPGKYVAVRVHDNGQGMTQEILNAACEPFFTTKTYGHGTGLGLSTVQGFARQSMGDFHLESTPGKGTIAEMYFPYVRMNATLNNQEIQDISTSARTLPVQDKLTVLVTEDDDSVRKVIAHILETANHLVLQAGSGEEAKQLIATHPEIDVLVSDVIMPGGINGYELANWVSGTHPGIRILIATGYDKEGSIVAVGNYPVIRKPFAPEDLIDAVNNLLSN